jgi:Zn-dependent protease with chaperone function/uncharacterized tellurite resistance protein B-like protein
MNFFGLQDQANRSTRKLVFLFILAVAATIISIYLAFVLLFMPPKGFDGNLGFHFLRLFSDTPWSQEAESGLTAWVLDRDWWNPALLFVVTGAITALVIGGGAYKISQLRQGGKVLASMLGGRPILSSTSDPDERILLNVVEEMAIASGTRVPGVYLMEQEPGINAFAAGFSSDDMVIGVTQGCLRLLNRDELQGVVAHEFSHILRGDMLLNMRLLGTVSGITLISTIGYFLLRFSTVGVRHDFGGSGSRARAKGGGGLGAGIIVLGALLFGLGYLGVFFSKLIKSAIGRQREFLADASAAQFTRNPEGLAGALKKIGGLAAQGSRIRSPNAPDASHFFFSNGLQDSFFRILATHPPLVERIQRLDPAFSGEFPRIEAPPDQTSVQSIPAPELAEGHTALIQTEAGFLDPEHFVDNIGIPTVAKMDYAAGLRESLPSALLDGLREPVGASAIVLSLLISPEEQIHALQFRNLQQDGPAAVIEEIKKLFPAVQKLSTETRIPLIDLAAQTLRNLSDHQYEQFCVLMDSMIAADNRVDLFEFCLQRILRRQLDAHFHGAHDLTIKHRKTEDVLPESLHLLSALAWIGQQEEADARFAFMAGAKQLNLSKPQDLIMASHSESRDLERIGRTLERLSLAAPYVKKNILLSCAHVVTSDSRVLETERELLRAIADSLGLPVPPFVRELIRHQNSTP